MVGSEQWAVNSEWTVTVDSDSGQWSGRGRREQGTLHREQDSGQG